MIACHLPRLARSHDMALALISSIVPCLKSPWNRSLPLPSRIKRRLILFPLSTSTHILDALCVIYSSSNGQGCPDHRVPPSHVCQRMMCLKPLEVTCPPLAYCCTSPCNGSNHRACLCNDGDCTRILFDLSETMTRHNRVSSLNPPPPRPPWFPIAPTCVMVAVTTPA